MMPHFKIFQIPVIERVSVKLLLLLLPKHICGGRSLILDRFGNIVGFLRHHCLQNTSHPLCFSLRCTPVPHNTNNVVICIGGSRSLAVSSGLGFKRSALQCLLVWWLMTTFYGILWAIWVFSFLKSIFWRYYWHCFCSHEYWSQSYVIGSVSFKPESS